MIYFSNKEQGWRKGGAEGANAMLILENCTILVKFWEENKKFATIAFAWKFLHHHFLILAPRMFLFRFLKEFYSQHNVAYIFYYTPKMQCSKSTSLFQPSHLSVLASVRVCIRNTLQFPISVIVSKVAINKSCLVCFLLLLIFGCIKTIF